MSKNRLWRKLLNICFILISFSMQSTLRLYIEDQVWWFGMHNSCFWPSTHTYLFHQNSTYLDKIKDYSLWLSIKLIFKDYDVKYVGILFFRRMLDCGSVITQDFSCQYFRFCLFCVCLVLLHGRIPFKWLASWFVKVSGMKAHIFISNSGKIMPLSSQRFHHSVEFLILFTLPKMAF